MGLNLLGLVVDSVADLLCIPDSCSYKTAFVLGYYEAGDGGGGAYFKAPDSCTSSHNGGSILVTNDNTTWLLSTTTPYSVKQFGAKGDGVYLDEPYIQAAADAIGRKGKLCIPDGIYNYNTLNFDGAVGLHLEGSGAIGSTTLRCISSLITDGTKLRSTFDCTISFITFDHSSTSFGGYLVDVSHKYIGAPDTQGLYFFRCTFASKDYNKYSAKGLNLNQSTLVTFEGCKFGSLWRPVDGQASTGGGYSNGIRFINCQVFDNIGYFANFLGEQWTFQDCNFQPCHDGAHRIAYTTNSVTWQSLCFINCGVYDAFAAGTSYLSLGNGGGLNFIGGMWGGRTDIASSALLNATGVISGINCSGTRFSLFTNVFVASAYGQTGWNISGGNRFPGCVNIFAYPTNIISSYFATNA